MNVRIGDRVIDRISGFKGITTGRTEYLNGCRQFCIKPEGLDKDGKLHDVVWMDEQNLEVLVAQVLPDPFLTSKTATHGGPDRKERAG